MIGGIDTLVKSVIKKVGSRKFAVATAVGAAAATGAIEITWPVAAVAIAYIASQAFVDYNN